MATQFRLLSVLSLFLLHMLVGCQDEIGEITQPPAGQVITSDTRLFDLIQRVALSDGSVDNIIDKTSCASLILPVTVVVNGQQLTVNSEEDFDIIERIFDEFATDYDTLRIVFPAMAILADHSVLTIYNEDELEDIADPCIEGGNDRDIECVDFQYPLNFSIYDSNNQTSDVIAINNDEELYDFFENIEKGDLVGFNFPIVVNWFDGEKIVINENDELEDVIESAIDDCDEDDDNDYNDDDVDDTALKASLMGGEWGITYFFSETDQTAAFDGFVFTFSADRLTRGEDGNQTVEGEWRTSGSRGFLELELGFDDAVPLIRLNNEWEVTQFNDVRVELQSEGKMDGVMKVIIFEKI